MGHPRSRLPWATAACRRATGRHARRFYFALLLLLVTLSGGIRVRSYLLARKIQVVLAGLEQVRIDATTEAQLLKALPHLVRDPRDFRIGAHVHRGYELKLSNEDDMWLAYRLRGVFLSLWPLRQNVPRDIPSDKWAVLDLPLKIAYVLGLRHLSFAADVTVLDGTVSSVQYHLEPDVFVGWPLSYLVVARSTHGFWRNRGLVPVSSPDDESPAYRFGALAGGGSFIAGADSSIGVAYTPDAPREKVLQAFQVDLSCFWSLRGCDSVRQVVPLLWKDRQEILDATAARLTLENPCPDGILAGRVRSLPDLNVALLEVVSSREVEVNREGDRTREIVTDYRLKEAILGHAEGPWTDIRYRPAMPWPLSPTGIKVNPGPLHSRRQGKSSCTSVALNLTLAGSFLPRLRLRQQFELRHLPPGGSKTTYRDFGAGCNSISNTRLLWPTRGSHQLSPKSPCVCSARHSSGAGASVRARPVGVRWRRQYAVNSH